MFEYAADNVRHLGFAFVVVALLSPRAAHAEGADASGANPPSDAANAPKPTTNDEAATPPHPSSTFGFGGGHAAYAIGGAVGDYSGFRQGLDLGVLGGYASYEGGSSSGLPGSQTSVVFGVSSLLGFGKYPTYIAGEIGGATNNAFTGGCAVIGPVVRVDPRAGGGLALRTASDAVLFQIGFEIVAILVPDRDIVFALTVGFGRN